MFASKLTIAFSTAVCFAQPKSIDVQDLIRKSVAATEADWAQAPNYNFIERDIESRKGGPKKIKTYQVMMIDGSPYNKLIAVNDREITGADATAAEQELQATIQQRKIESASERSRRIGRYQKEREHDHLMMRQMIEAFDYKLVGETRLDGRDVYQLAATPKPGWKPPNHDARVLTGMKGTLWIDKETCQWVKVEAEVIHPVLFFGFLAKVGPGTRFELEQAPLEGGLWMPKHFSTQVHAMALGMINENSTDDETYKDYRASADVTRPAVVKR